jgi:phage-related protein
MTRPKPRLKSLRWVGWARKDLSGMPRPVKRTMGFALYLAQVGERHPAAKALKGFGSAGVLEVVEEFRSDAYRAVYTVRLTRAVYVLHCFKKKSVKGARTPRPDTELIRARLQAAERMDREG